MNRELQPTRGKAQLIITPLAWVMIALGAALRLAYFSTGRSLWLDEAMLALNITGRNFAELLQPLEYNQAAPPGFLWMEKLVTFLAGESDWALRIVPLAASLLSLFLFWRVSRKWLPAGIAVAGMGLFAITPILVRYSTEVKQYSVDLTVGLLILLVMHPFLEGRQTSTDWYILAAIGVIAPWFSHPAVFLMVIAGLVMFFCVMEQRDGRSWWNLAGLAVSWLAGMGIYYALNLRGVRENEVLDAFWEAYFPTLQDISASFQLLRNIPSDVMGIKPDWLAALLMVLGLWYLIRKGWKYALMLVAPVLVTYFAAGLHLYPFYRRFLIFLVPSLVILTISSLAFVWELFRERNPRFGAVLVLLALGIGIFIHPVQASYNFLRYPDRREDIKPVLQEMNGLVKPDDMIYLYYAAEPAFRFYAPKMGLWIEENLLIGQKHITDPQNYLRDLQSLQGKGRVWFVFSHVINRNGINEEDYILGCLGWAEQAKNILFSRDVRVYLFNLRQSGLCEVQE